MLYAAMHFTVKKTNIRFKEVDYFPGLNINGTLASGEYGTVYTSNPILMLFAIIYMQEETSWIVRGELRLTLILDRNNKAKIDYFVTPDSFVETINHKNAQKPKSLFARIDLANKYNFNLNHLKSLIFGMIYFEAYVGVQPSPEVKLEERLKFFKKTLEFEMASLAEVKAAISESFLAVLSSKTLSLEVDAEEQSRPGLELEKTFVSQGEISKPNPRPSASTESNKKSKQ